MASTWVIRLVQDGKKKTPILIKVSRKEGGDNLDLDLDLLATDGEAAFTAKGKLRADKCSARLPLNSHSTTTKPEETASEELRWI